MLEQILNGSSFSPEMQQLILAVTIFVDSKLVPESGSPQTPSEDHLKSFPTTLTFAFKVYATAER